LPFLLSPPPLQARSSSSDSAIIPPPFDHHQSRIFLTSRALLTFADSVHHRTGHLTMSFLLELRHCRHSNVKRHISSLVLLQISASKRFLPSFVCSFVTLFLESRGKSLWLLSPYSMLLSPLFSWSPISVSLPMANRNAGETPPASSTCVRALEMGMSLSTPVVVVLPN
jgi:hypothetical protein